MTRTRFHGDPTPCLSASVRDDMEEAALDSLRQGREPSPHELRLTYGFTHAQVDAFGDDAIAGAQRVIAQPSSADARIARLQPITVDEVMGVAQRVWLARDPCDAACTVSVRETLAMASLLLTAEEHLRARLLKEGDAV